MYRWPTRPTEVLFGVSLEVPDRSLTCLMGRNGVGKSTLLNAVAGLLPTRSGSVRIDDHDISRTSVPRRARAGIGYVPQGHQVFPNLSVEENLLVVWERDRRRDRSAIDQALDVFPALRNLYGRAAGAAVRRPGPAAGDRPGAGVPAQAAGARRADRGDPTVDHHGDRGLHRPASTGRPG